MKKYDMKAAVQYAESKERIKSWMELTKQMKEYKAISDRLYHQLRGSILDYWDLETDKLEATAYYESSEELGGTRE